MNVWDILILLAVVGAPAFALYRQQKRRQAGKGCCGSCAMCPGCAACGQERKDTGR